MKSDTKEDKRFEVLVVAADAQRRERISAAKTEQDRRPERTVVTWDEV